MNNIKKLRKQHKLSQIEFAQRLNVHQTAVSQWETGRTQPDIDTLKRIADYFNCSVDYLLGTSDIAFRVTPYDAYTSEATTPRFDELTQTEKRVITAYRENPDMQSAVRRLLNIEV